MEGGRERGEGVGKGESGEEMEEGSGGGFYSNRRLFHLKLFALAVITVKLHRGFQMFM